jgi:excisionase family DNA binding protein
MATAAAKIGPTPRYGSPAEVAALLGLSTKTIRRLIAAETVPAFRVGRRVLVSYRDTDQFIRQQRRAPSMATAHRPANAESEARAPYVPRISAEELARRNQSAMALLEAWKTEGDEEEQRATMEVLREALGPRRVASSRDLFP